jgi:hypothetical protein
MFKNTVSRLLKVSEICVQDFIKRSLVDMKRAVASWLDEPSTYSATILNSFHFLIDGKAKKDIETFIKKKPKERTETNFKQDCVNYLHISNFFQDTEPVRQNFMFFNQHCLTCRPSGSSVSRDASIILLAFSHSIHSKIKVD